MSTFYQKEILLTNVRIKKRKILFTEFFSWLILISVLPSNTQTIFEQEQNIHFDLDEFFVSVFITNSLTEKILTS